MTEKTITWVSPIGSEPDRFENYYLNVAFSDETVGYIGGKAEAIEKRWNDLTELIGKPTDFQLEDKGTTSKGKPKFKILGYGGAGGSRVMERPASPAQAESINRSVALKAAAEVSMVQDVETVLEIADRFFNWLQGNK